MTWCCPSGWSPGSTAYSFSRKSGIVSNSSCGGIISPTSIRRVSSHSFTSATEPSWTEISIPGYLLLIERIIFGTKYAAATGKAPIRIRPFSNPFSAEISCSTLLNPLRISRKRIRTRLPTSVSISPLRRSRSSSFTSISVSSAEIARLTAGWVIFSSRPALVKLPVSAILTNRRI
ncbi:hypothetical protein D3C81_1507520 [compost metagenome]